MSETFMTVLVVVAVVGVLLCFTGLLWPFAAADELGRTGSWMHHEDEDPLDARPDGNKDAAIPLRPLRSRR